MRSESEFLRFWEQTDFSTFNEADVRELFIRDLLYLLGYSKNTIHDVVTEKTLALGTPFQRVGRKTIRIDYVPTIRLKSFWILEAKPGQPKEMSVGDMLQAYLYARHPEIQVPYIVLCNGWSLKVYEIDENIEWDTPIIEMSAENCRELFPELKEILSAPKILETLRKRLLKTIYDTFSVEVDMNRYRNFCNKFHKVGSEIENKIRENEKDVWMKEWHRKEEQASNNLRNCSDEALIWKMDSYGYMAQQYGGEFLRRLSEANEENQRRLYMMLLNHLKRRCHSTYRIHVLSILLKMRKIGLSVNSIQMEYEPCRVLNRVIFENLSYAEDEPLTRALMLLDRSVCGFSAIFLKRSFMKTLEKTVKEMRDQMPAEERIAKNPTIADIMVQLICIYAEMLWQACQNENSPERILRFASFLEHESKEIIKKEPVVKYPDGNEDLLWYDFYPSGFDLLINTTCMLVNDDELINALDLSPEFKGILKLPWEANELYKEYIPLIPLYELTHDEKKEFVEKAFRALIEAMGMVLGKKEN